MVSRIPFAVFPITTAPRAVARTLYKAPVPAGGGWAERIDVIYGVAYGIRVRVETVGVAERIALQKPAERWVVFTVAIIVEAGGGVKTSTNPNYSVCPVYLNRMRNFEGGSITMP